jgi:hypothetical protein
MFTYVSRIASEVDEGLSDRLRRFVIAVFVDIACSPTRNWPDVGDGLLWPRGVIIEANPT